MSPPPLETSQSLKISYEAPQYGFLMKLNSLSVSSQPKTLKKLYKKGRKKGEYLRISIYICNTKLRDLLSQNPPSINNQQHKKREGS